MYGSLYIRHGFLFGNGEGNDQIRTELVGYLVKYYGRLTTVGTYGGSVSSCQHKLRTAGGTPVDIEVQIFKLKVVVRNLVGGVEVQFIQSLFALLDVAFHTHMTSGFPFPLLQLVRGRTGFLL